MDRNSLVELLFLHASCGPSLISMPVKKKSEEYTRGYSITNIQLPYLLRNI